MERPPRGLVYTLLEARLYDKMLNMEIIASHENTDFDGLASILAASKLYPEAIPLLARRMNRNLRDFLTLYWDELPFLRPEDLPRQPIERLILVDTQSIPPLKGLRKDTQVMIIDHHPLDRELEPGMHYRGGETGSTTALLVQEMMERHLSLSPVEATLLLLGIYEDTGSLTYPDTTPSDIRCAAWLLERGANLEVVNDFLHQPITEAQRELYQRLLEGAEFHDFQGRSVLISSVSAPDYEEEISTLAHKLRDLYDPDALFVLVRLNERIQMVARSTTDAVDVAQIARHFQGGGHSKAAAALIEGMDLRTAKEELLRLLDSYVKPTTTVREIMSFGVHTLSPKTTVAQAEEMMRRWGHEGFPVVEEGRLVGVLTRGEIDRALHHGLHKEPIENYMHKGEMSVSPSDSVERLQQVMMEQGLGQIPVVEGGQIVGIVTRTDLIKLWSVPLKPSRAPEVTKRMEEMLPSTLLALLREAGKMAKGMGYSLYLVGGFVRDLLLGVSNLDIDLVVEGEAIALARRLAQEVGGRVHSHTRFGTAKLIFEEEPSPIAPLSSLDFTTARTEFYEHPTALPQVERSSIKQDLHRRDFTINTLAISLDEDSYGELLDFYGGEGDLKRGLIRVLHNLSFVEDPTRILRAVRLEQRLGFRLEVRTEELIHDALDLLPRVSGERIRQELEAIFQEEKPTKALRRLQELGLLEHIHPLLRYAEELGKLMEALPTGLAKWRALSCREEEREKGEGADCALYLALLAREADLEAVEGLIKRLQIAAVGARLLRQIGQLGELTPRLMERRLPRSALYRLLNPYSSEAPFVLWLTSPSKRVRGRLELYHGHLACVEPALDGQDLKRMGLPPGPIYSLILEALRDARLDGKVRSRKGEERLIRKILKRGL